MPNNNVNLSHRPPYSAANLYLSSGYKPQRLSKHNNSSLQIVTVSYSITITRHFVTFRT